MQVLRTSSSFLVLLLACCVLAASASADEAMIVAAALEQQHELLDVVVEPDGSTSVKARLEKKEKPLASASAETPVAPLAEQEDGGEEEEEEYDEEGYDELGEYDEEEHYEDEEEEFDYDAAEHDEEEDDGRERTPEEIAEMYGEPQTMEGYNASYLLDVHAYMRDVVPANPKYREVLEHCLNKEADCTLWAQTGECEKNPAYMLTSCGPACRSCDKLLFEERCPMDPKLFETDAWKAGDLNKFFERITTHPHYQKYNPTVICKPGMHNDHLKGDCPWVVTMDGFLTDLECDTLVEQGGLLGYERSEDVGERNPDGSYGSVQSSGRTSTNAWCSETCLTNETVKGVIQKLENLTGIPDANSEQLQLLRYEVSQHYNSHHDFIDHDVGRRAGPRILTVFLYLNDVEAGGATHFTDLDIAVYPKKGRVLLWPSVLDQDPNGQDYRTHHQAMPVEAGIKYGANAWVHLRDFKAPYADGCT